MKKNVVIFYLWPFMLLLLASGLIRCKGEPGASGQRDFHLAMADSIINEYNRNQPDWDRGTKTEGNVNIIVKTDRIVIEQDPDAGTDLLYFFLQTDHPDTHLKSGPFGRAEVIYLDRNLLVNSLEGKKRLHFYIETDRKPDFVQEIDGCKSFGGYGMGLRKITKGSPSDSAPYCGCNPAEEPPGNCNSVDVNQVKCASANSNGSCRVSCSSQTYACCDRGYE